MPKASKNKYYAVKLGREGPKIYNTWDECNTNVSRYPGAIHKSFTSLTQAEEWLKVPTPISLGDSHNVSLLPPSNRSTRMPHRASSPPSKASAHEAEGSVSMISDEETGSSTSNCVSPVVLSPEQTKVLQMVQRGRSVFFTGSAGTGKSVLLREIIKALGGATSSTLGITASTGIASVNIGGATIHSWAGIGLGQEPAKKLAGKILGQKTLLKVRERWWNVQALIIDEVSMIDGSLFDKLVRGKAHVH
jgi:ATP-dependent DNA helicase PIF1